MKALAEEFLDREPLVTGNSSSGSGGNMGRSGNHRGGSGFGGGLKPMQWTALLSAAIIADDKELTIARSRRREPKKDYAAFVFRCARQAEESYANRIFVGGTGVQDFGGDAASQALKSEAVAAAATVSTLPASSSPPPPPPQAPASSSSSSSFAPSDSSACSNNSSVVPTGSLSVAKVHHVVGAFSNLHITTGGNSGIGCGGAPRTCGILAPHAVTLVRKAIKVLDDDELLDAMGGGDAYGGLLRLILDSPYYISLLHPRDFQDLAKTLCLLIEDRKQPKYSHLGNNIPDVPPHKCSLL